MTVAIDYYLSLNSPWTYLGGERFAEIAQRHRAEVRVKPVDFGVIFPQSGGLPLPKRAPQRQAYRLVELERWRDFLHLPLSLHPKHWPAADGAGVRLVIAAGESGGNPLALSQALLHAVWAGEHDIAEEATLLAAAAETGHDAPALLARSQDVAMQQLYERYTAEALAAGVFGAPSYVVFRDGAGAGEIFWGQDRLDLLDWRLSQGIAS